LRKTKKDKLTQEELDEIIKNVQDEHETEFRRKALRLYGV